MLLSYRVEERWQRDEGALPILHLAADCAEIVKILRLLSGTARILVSHSDDEAEFVCQRNYFNPEHEINEGQVDSVLSYIFEEIPSTQELQELLVSIRYQNIDFYQNIRGEIILLLIALINNRATESFLYIYRLLERMSVATPLIYVSREINFKAAYSFLSSIVEGEKTIGDLGLLQKFLSQLAVRQENFRENKVDFSFSSYPGWFGTEVIRQIRSIGSDQKYLEIDEDDVSIKVPFKDMSLFIAFIRNRSFHNQGSRQNFDFTRLGGAEQFLSAFVHEFAYWFAYIFIEFAKWQMDRASR